MAGAFQVDATGPFPQVGGVEQLLGREPHVSGIGHVRVQIGEGHARGFDLHVHALGRADGGVFVRQVFQDSQRDQGGDALTVRRDLVHLVATETDLDRLDPFGPVRSQIGHAQGSAVLRGKGADGLCQASPVEGLAPRARDVFQRVGLLRETPHLAGDRRAPLGHEGVKAGERAQLVDCIAPLPGNDRAHREAVACVAQRVDEQVFERQRAEALRQRRPARHLARHRDGVPAARRHVGHALEAIRVPAGRGAPRCVQAMQPVAFPHQRERIAADAVHYGFDDSEGDGGGQCRIDGVATARKSCSAGLRGQGLRCGDDIAGQHRLSAGGMGEVRVHGRARLEGESFGVTSHRLATMAWR